MDMRFIFYFIMAPIFFALAACSGTQTYTPIARAGDTVSLAVGWQKTLLRQNLTVTITDANNSVTTYSPNDAHVRAIVNLYPDPVSKAVVDTATGRVGNGTRIGNLINSQVTGQDNEWWQTTIVLDLPSAMAIGNATISISDSAGATVLPLIVTIVPGAGTSNLFNIYTPGGGNSSFPLLGQGYYPGALGTFEREPSNTVTFVSSTVIPHSIQMQFSHTAGIGTTWVVNPRGDIKDIMWRDTGSVITVMLMPTQGSSLTQILDFKFYISGGITNLSQVAGSLKAYDVNGNPLSGVTASIQ